MKDSQRITLLISQTLTLYRTHLHARFAQCNIDLTSEMLAVLIFLWESDGRNHHELANCLFKDKGGITKIINSLEKRGLVVRQVDAADGRNKIVKLTKAGKNMKEKVLPIRNKLLNEMTNGIGSQKLNITKQTLTDIIDRLK